MPPPNKSARARARQELLDVFVLRFGAPTADLRHGRAGATVFSVDSAGDTVMCLRFHLGGAAKAAQGLRDIETMLSYCAAAALTPRALVVAHASGSLSYAQRPDLHLIESMVADGTASSVLWCDADAVSRSAPCAWQHFHALADDDTELHLMSLRRVVDLVDDELLLNVMLAVSAAESRSIRERTVRPLMRRADAGRPLGPPPFGFRVNGAGDWEVDPAVWPLVHEVFHRYLTTSSVARLREQMRTRHGVDLSADRLRRILTDLIYVDGRRVQLVAGQPFATVPVALDDPVPGALFDAVAAEMARRRR